MLEASRDDGCKQSCLLRGDVTCSGAARDELISIERHEFHLLDTFTAYCICGWTDTQYSTTDPPNLITPRVAQAYRDHL